MNFMYGRCLSGPDVHVLGESHREVVRVAPVHDVQVEVIPQLRSVEDLEGDLGYLPCLLLREDGILEVSNSLEWILPELWERFGLVNQLEL